MPGDFLSALRSAPNTPEAKIATFLAEFRPEERCVWAFYEGRDDPSFFRVHIEKSAHDARLRVRLLGMKNKLGVLNARTYLQERYPDDPHILFLVDKDHDDFLSGGNGVRSEGTLYVTRYYSIENYCVGPGSLRAILVDIWGLDDSGDAIRRATHLFATAANSFHEKTRVWMAWTIAARRRGGRPECDNVPLRSLLEFSSDLSVSVKWPSDLSGFLAEKTKVEAGPGLPDVELVESELKGKEPKTWLRGKAELDFFIAFLEKLRSLLPKSTLPKLRTCLCTKNAIEALAPRLPCPIDLKDFLNDRLGRIPRGSPG